MEKVQFLGGSRLKINLICLFILIINQSCFQKKDDSIIVTKDLSSIEKIQQNDLLIINTIKEFYISYISEKSKNELNQNSINEIKQKYITNKLLLNIDKRMEDGSLDWDPFVNAQDFYDGWIKTLKIKSDESKKNLYVVSYFDGNKDVKIYLGIIKEKNQYKIDFIEDQIIETTKQEKLEDCFYKNLIKDKTIHVIKSNTENSQSLKINIVANKSNSVSQEINYEPFSFNFNCSSTLYKDDLPTHNEYEIIVGDFNFDSLEDFAILYDNSINTGTIFSFFFQNSEGMFNEDENFPLKFIPTKINNIDKTLEQVNIIGCCKINTTIYQLDESNKWEVISSKQESMK
jgi:Protein of unknown function (DUF3828)